jgi:methionyl-tRNA synthetase
VLSAERVEGSDKLLHLMVDLGDEEPHSVASGIAKSIAPEDVVGKRFVFVTNLKPRKVFKIPSEAMLLAADDADGGLSLASLPDSVPPGAEIS